MAKLLIHGGRVIDPSQDLDGSFDLLIEDGARRRGSTAASSRRRTPRRSTPPAWWSRPG